jgi:hypothetical protein
MTEGYTCIVCGRFVKTRVFPSNGVCPNPECRDKYYKTPMEHLDKMKQKTFGTPDTEILKPILKEIEASNYSELELKVAFKDGVVFEYKYPNSKEDVKIIPVVVKPAGKVEGTRKVLKGPFR